MGNRQTTKNLLFYLGLVLVIAAALIVYGSYSNKAQAPSSDTTINTSTSGESVIVSTGDEADLNSIETDLNSSDDLNSTSDLDSAQSDLDSIDLSNI